MNYDVLLVQNREWQHERLRAMSAVNHSLVAIRPLDGVQRNVPIGTGAVCVCVDAGSRRPRVTSIATSSNAICGSATCATSQSIVDLSVRQHEVRRSTT